MTETIELKPCPMCGGKAYYRDTVDFSSVRCGSCQLETKMHNDQDGALCSWNRRADHIVDADKLVPEGFVLVPVEPTEDELRKVVSFTLKAKLSSDYTWMDYAADMHKIMIQAAQKEGE